MKLSRTHTIVLANQKGGCGKTTTAISLAAGFALEGYATTLVDLDPQCNVTTNFGIDLDGLARDGKFTILDAFMKKRPADRIRLPMEGRLANNLSLLPGHRALDQVHAALEAEIKASSIRDGLSPYDEDDERDDHRNRLGASLQALHGDQDIIVIDTAPALDFLMASALIAADWYVIPVFASGYDLQGLSKLTATVKTIRERANPALRRLGVVLGNFDQSTVLDSDIYDQLKQKFGDEMFETRISRAVAHREATVNTTTIYEQERGGRAAEQFRALTGEALERIKAAEESAVLQPQAPPTSASTPSSVAEESQPAVDSLQEAGNA